MEQNETVIKKSFSWDYLDKLTTQGLSLIISIVLARIIAPEQYGIIAMAFIFIQILDAFVNPGFTSALIQKKIPDKIDYSTIFWSNIGISVILYLIIFLLSPLIERFYEIENLSIVIRVLALNLPFQSVNSIVMAYIRKNTKYRRYFFVSFAGTVIAGGTAIIMAYSGFGIWALVANNLVNAALDAVLSLLFISWKPTLDFSKERFKILYSFGGKMLYIKMIDIFYTELSGFIIGKKYTPTDLSFYKKGTSYPKTIIENLSMSISDVIFPMFSNIQDEKEKRLAALKKSIKLSEFIIFPMAIGFFSCADTFVSVFLTDKWLPCVPFIRVMCLYYLCSSTGMILLQFYKALGKGSLLLRLEFFKKSYSVLLILFATFVFNSPIAVLWATTIAGFISMLVNLITAAKHADYKIVDYLKGMLPIACISLATLVGVVSLGYLNINSLLKLIIQVFAGIFIYVGLAFVFRFEQVSDLLSLVNKNRKAGRNI